MRKIFYSFLSLGIILTLNSCGGDSETTEETATDLTEEVVDESNEEEVEEAVVNPFEGKTAIAIRESWTSDKPGGKKEGVKYLKKFAFGNKLKMVGDTAKIGSGTYYKLITPDGTEGWASTWSIAPDAKVGVVVGTASIYQSPDITSVTSNKLEAGEIVVLLNNDMGIGFNEFFTKNKGKKGWIKAGDKVSENDTDLELAIMISNANKNSDNVKKLNAYNEILENSSYASSPLYEGLTNLKTELEENIAKEESEVVEETEAVEGDE